MGEKPAPGSTISDPALVTPEAPACTAPAVEASAAETWTLHPVTASSTTARDAAAVRALRRNMDGILLTGTASRCLMVAPSSTLTGQTKPARSRLAHRYRPWLPDRAGHAGRQCRWPGLASGCGHHPDSRFLARRLVLGRGHPRPPAGRAPRAGAHAARHGVEGRRPIADHPARSY